MVYFAWRCAQRFRLGSISRTLPFPVPKRKGASFPASPPNPAETGSPSRFCMRRGGQEHGCKGFPKTRVALPPHSMKDVWMNGWMGGCAASCLMFCMKLLTSLGRMDPIWADCRAWVGSVCHCIRVCTMSRSGACGITAARLFLFPYCSRV